VKRYVLILSQTGFWYILGDFFSKRIWSLWLATASRSQLDRKPITAITELKKGGKFKMI
jgi:hypothetical protein